MLHSHQAKAKSQVTQSRTIKILLADDQKFVQRKLERMLSPKANLQVVGVADDGKGAIALVETLNPDAILIDIEMPKMNGIEAASVINRRFPNCKIIALSSHESPEYVQQIIAAGADGYILKTTSPEDLVTAIESVCKGYSYFDSQLLKQAQISQHSRLSTAQSDTPSSMLPARKRYRFAAKWLVWSGLGMAIAVGGWWSYNYYFDSSVKPVPVEVRPVEKGTVEITVSESGKLELGEQQTLKSPKENATVERVNVTQGDSIEAGEALIVLRDRDTQEQEQEQKLEITKSLLTQEKNEKTVLEAQEKVKKEQALVRESAELFQKGYIAESELEEDREQLEAAKSELNDAKLESDSAKLDLQHGQAKLDSVRQKLNDRFVTSPIDGIVLDVGVRDGDGITTDTKLLTIGDPEREIVNLQLTTLNASKVKLNQAARVSVIGPNPQVYTGKVVSLSPQATTESLNSDSDSGSSDGSAKVNATVLLNQPSKTIIPGSQVNVEIIAQQRQNVVTLPIEMVQKLGNEPFVWVKDEGGRAKKQPVTLGLEDLSSVEITSGLQPGEEVILPLPDSTLIPGTPLQTDLNVK